MTASLMLVAALHEQAFEIAEPSEVVARIAISCLRCSWGEKGREGAVLVLSLDGRYSQHLVLTRSDGEYRVGLGELAAGTHRLSIVTDRKQTPAGVGEVTIRELTVSASDDVALAHAPWLYVRGNAIGHFTDVPLLMWHETEPTPRGRWIRYSVVFSNEDGGTPADGLMATWGRLTDIEYVYGVELDTAGRVLAEEYQGREHEILAFRGRREGRHPLLWVVTDNNMFSDRGKTKERAAPAPVPWDLIGASREVVMDANPWTYRVSAEEVRREGRVDDAARPGSGKIKDPLGYVYLEACGELRDAILAFDIGYGDTWAASDGGRPGFRVERSGCFRGAVAVPPGARLETLRLRAYARPLEKGEARRPKGASRARLTSVNRLFRLGPDHVPGPDLFRWTGDQRLEPDGPPLELSLASGR